MDYCDPADLYSYGLPRGSVPNAARLVASTDTTANTFTLGDHGLADNDPFMLRPEGGTTASMAAPLTANVTYYAAVVSDHQFSARAAPDGAVIDLTTAGARMVLVVPLPIPAAITWASSVLDQFLPAHAAPLEGMPIPPVLRATCAELAAGKVLKVMGRQSKTITDMIKDASVLVQRWAKGVPIRGENAPETHTNLARPATAPWCDRRGWQRFGGIS